jgi:hypothetical protein
MHVKSILHEFGTCKIDFRYIRYYLAAKIDFTVFPILAAPDLLPVTQQATLEHVVELGKALDVVQVDSRGICEEIGNCSIKRKLNS